MGVILFYTLYLGPRSSGSRCGVRIDGAPAGASPQRQSSPPKMFGWDDEREPSGKVVSRPPKMLGVEVERPTGLVQSYPVQPREVPRDADGSYLRGPRSGSHRDELRGAAEPHDADEHAPIHQIDQRLQQEGGELGARPGAALCPLQPRQ